MSNNGQQSNLGTSTASSVLLKRRYGPAFLWQWLAVVIVILIAAAVGLMLSSKTPKTNQAQSQKSQQSTAANKVSYGKDKGKYYCVDSSKTIHTPVFDFFGQNHLLITAYADSLVQQGGSFWVSKDGQIMTQAEKDKAPQTEATKHSITSGKC
jgi:hypothetical protein